MSLWPADLFSRLIPPLWATAAAAATQGPTSLGAPLDGSQGMSFGTDLLRMIVVLGVVLAVIYISLNWGLRKLMGGRAGVVGGGSVVKVVQRIPLDPKRALFVIQVADEYLLVGGGEGSLSLIAKLDREVVDRLLTKNAGAGPVLSPFLQKLLARRGGPPPPKA